MKPIVAFAAGIAVGVAGMVGRMALAGAETDPVKISPQYYTVRIDNDWLRVVEYRLRPGQKEPMHSHPHGFVYMLADARARVSLPDGSSSVLDEHAGDVTWRGLTTHAFENVGDTDVHAIGVELKPCAPQ
jgi:quercetin dioxygenase-like cupin family protein